MRLKSTKTQYNTLITGTFRPHGKEKGPAQGPSSFSISQESHRRVLKITRPSCVSPQPRIRQQSSYDTRRELLPSRAGEDTGETTSRRSCDGPPYPAGLLRRHHGRPTVPAPSREAECSSSGSAPWAPGYSGRVRKKILRS